MNKLKHWMSGIGGFTALLAIYACGALVLKWSHSLAVQPRTVYYFFALTVLISIPYLFLVRSSLKQLSWKRAGLILFAAHLLTPSLLQTDQLRYIWDGIEVARLHNPYIDAPNTFQEFTDSFWMKDINHPHLRTIYPPVTQLVFGLATLLNPWLWQQAFGFDTGLIPTSFWQIEIGWKAMVGIFSVFLCFLYRRHKFQLIVAHPLYITLIVGNGHVDIVYVTLLMTTLHPSVQKKIFRPVQALAAAILAKWLPLMFVPLFTLQWWRRYGFTAALKITLVLTFVVVCTALLFNRGTNNGLFESLTVYLDQWYFLGYVHQLLMPIIKKCCSYWQAAAWARNICAGLFVLWAGFIFLWFYQGKCTLRLACLLLFTGFLVFNPTLHPWYFTALVCMALPYRKVLVTPWLWPLLAQYSVLFYIDNQDPIIVRYAVYIVVTIFLMRDLRQVFVGPARPRITI